MAKVNPCGHTEAQHLYFAEGQIKLDLSECEVAAALRGEIALLTEEISHQNGELAQAEAELARLTNEQNSNQEGEKL